MYEELCVVWLQEIKAADLCKLTSDFYERLTTYVKEIRIENKMLDKKMVKAILLEHELKNVRRMIEDIVWARYSKIVQLISEGEKIPIENLTTEEMQIVAKFPTMLDSFQTFVKNLLLAELPNLKSEETNRRVLLIFKEEIPQIVGADMQSYGPFMPEDIASVPMENARILVKQGLAALVQTK